MFAWLKSMFHREPDFIVGGADNPYLLRWFLIPRNRLFNVYLHKFVRDDDDRALHDHPWWFISIMLRGMYTEVVAHDDEGNGRGFVRAAPSIAFRTATHRHRVVLETREGKSVPCWTVVITGPRVREWGFWCPQGWRHWKEFTAGKNGETVGKGCD